jgi:gluconate 2-dehydrogenase gamma chain
MTPSTELPAMDRRALLRSALLLVGGSIASGAPLELFARSTPKPTRFFSAAQFALLEEVADIMIPRTDTPGAREVGVPEAFDTLVKQWASPQRQLQFRAVLDDIQQTVMAKEGKAFMELAFEQRVAFISSYDSAKLLGSRAYAKFKELLLTLYYLSEAGATQELRYEHTPGAWEAATPVTPQTRAWAL